MKSGSFGLATSMSLTVASFAQTPIMYGGTNLGTIACRETDTFSFEGNTGDRVIMHLTETSDLGGICNNVACCCFDQRIRLLDQNGDLIAETATPGEGNVCSHRLRTVLGPVLLASDATYTITVRDASGEAGNGRGTYSLFLQSTNNPAQDVPIISGAKLLVPLQTPGEVDTYTFSAREGNQVVATMTPGGQGNVQPRLALYDPAGNPVALPAGGSIDIDVTSSGDFTLLAFSSIDQTGTYELSLTIDPGAEPCIADLDGDGTVGIVDFLDLLAAWGPCP